MKRHIPMLMFMADYLVGTVPVLLAVLLLPVPALLVGPILVGAGFVASREAGRRRQRRLDRGAR